jgi:hypothetical protein
MKKTLEDGSRVIKFDFPADQPYEIDLWRGDEPVWTFMVEEKDVLGNLVLVFPTLPKEHFAFEVELTPVQEDLEHYVVVPARALRQLVSEFRRSRDDLARSACQEDSEA